MTPREPVTVAEETITLAMMSATTCCVLAAYIALKVFELADLSTYELLGVGGMVVIGSVVPRLTAAWIGSTVEKIMH